MRDLTKADRSAPRGALRDCPVCRKADPRPVRGLTDLFSGERFLAVGCTLCGLVFLADPPPASDLDRYYANELGHGMRSEPGRIFQTLRRQLIRKDLRTLLPHLVAGDRIVDLGTGDGAVAVELHRLGYSVVACDLFSADEWRHAEIPYRKLEAGWDFAGVVAATGAPSVLVLRHVLEHVHEPRVLLELAHAQGVRVLDVTVPNLESRLRRHLGESWYHWDPPRHMTYFSPGTVHTLAARTGYRVAHLNTYGIDELVTAAYRALSLRAVKSGPRAERAMRRTARVFQPKGLLAGIGSAAAHPLGNCVIRCILTQESRTESMSSPPLGTN